MVQLELKGRDAWWTVLAIDPIAGPLVCRIASVRWLTPNRLTLGSIVLAVAAGAGFAVDALVLGAVLYQTSFLVDCLDGKLAGLRGVDNPWGDFIDQSGDHIRFLVCLAGMTYGALNDSGDDGLWAAAAVTYACARFSILVLGQARPRASDKPPNVAVSPTPSAILRSAPKRLTVPGTTVDTETVAFTFAPLLSHPLIGIAIAGVVDLLHLTAMLASSWRQGSRSVAASAGTEASRRPSPTP